MCAVVRERQADKSSASREGVERFVKVSLRPGETKKVSVTLDSRSLSYYESRRNSGARRSRRVRLCSLAASSEQIECVASSH